MRCPSAPGALALLALLALAAPAGAASRQLAAALSAPVDPAVAKERAAAASCDGLHLPPMQWRATVAERCGAAAVRAAGASEVRSSFTWVLADAAAAAAARASGGAAAAPRAPRRRHASYSVREVARVSEPVRDEIVSRFGDILNFGRGDIAVLSPAILPAAGGSGGFDYYSRVMAKPGQDAFGTSVWHSKLQRDLSPTPGSLGSELTVVYSHADAANGPEDPRAILGPGGSPLLVFNAKFAADKPRSMFLADLGRGSVARLHVHGMGERTQKNWAPFWHAGALHFLYATQPLTVLRCTGAGAGGGAPEDGTVPASAAAGAAAAGGSNCTCTFSAVAGGCAEIERVDAFFRLRLGSPLTEIGDSGLFFTALHSQVLAAGGSRDVLGYTGHLALLSSNPWGWVAVSGEVKFAPGASCDDRAIRNLYPRGIAYPTTALLVGARAESLLVAAHFNDAESSVQQLAFDEPLVDVVAALAETACAAPPAPGALGAWVRARHGHHSSHGAAEDAAAHASEGAAAAAFLTTSRGGRVPRCGAWATLGSLEAPALASLISPLISAAAFRRLQNDTNASTVCVAGTYFARWAISNADIVCTPCSGQTYRAADLTGITSATPVEANCPDTCVTGSNPTSDKKGCTCTDSSTTWSASANACWQTSCPSSDAEITGDGASALCRCSAGFFAASGSGSGLVCTACTAPAGSYCPAGSTATTGSLCPGGSYCVGGAAAPVTCPTTSTAGYVTDLSTTGQWTCKCAASYAWSFTSNTCATCPAGSYCAGGACSAGNTCVGAYNTATLCAAGTFSSAPGGASTCTACTAGTNYASSPGATSCAACSTCSGLLTTSAGCTPSSAPVCHCPAGYSQSSTLPGSVCTACVAGTSYSVSAGSAACSTCTACDSNSQVVTPEEACTATTETVCRCKDGFNQTSSAPGASSCAGGCTPGYYCVGSSVSPCGSAAVFCELGSGAPRTVSAGYYSSYLYNAQTSVRGNEAYRTAQTACPPDRLCSNGVLVKAVDLSGLAGFGAAMSDTTNLTTFGNTFQAVAPGFASAIAPSIVWSVVSITPVGSGCTVPANYFTVESISSNTGQLRAGAGTLSAVRCSSGVSVKVRAERSSLTASPDGDTTYHEFTALVSISQTTLAPVINGCAGLSQVPERDPLGTSYAGALNVTNPNAGTTLLYKITSSTSIPANVELPFTIGCNGELVVGSMVYFKLATSYNVTVQISNVGLARP